MNYEFHPIADIFPLLPDVELRELADDIEAEGLREAIWLYEGKILDGRNRYKACQLAGVSPVMRQFTGESPTAFVISLNLKRRHLTVSQRTGCAVEAMPWFEKEARARKVQSGMETGRGNKKVNPKKGEPLQASDHAGKAFRVSGSYVEEAKAIKEKAPESFKAILSGEKTISEVKREIKKAEVTKKIAALPSDKFRVLYVDPPWKYGNSGAGLDEIGYGPAERHYPCLTIAELCAMPVLGIVDDNAVLFLWVTSPLLDECWPVIRAWGFEYKASFVWDKIRHNVGNYNSVRHEFLLICTRGSCTPDVRKLHDSVQTIKRPGKHSEKPEHFRQIIDEIYPHGKRIELFARKKTKGWEVYGNEA